MAVLLLALFPVLVLFNTPVALASLAVAIVLLYRGRTEAARPVSRQREHADHSI